MKLRVTLDETDVKILEEIEKQGTKVSTRELSEKLGIPGRTIRYRLTRLKEKKFMKPDFVSTHERKLGLAEYSIFLRTIPRTSGKLKKALDEIDPFYYYSTSFGRYEGYLVHCLYPLSNPRLVPTILEELKKHELVAEYHLMDLMDYERKGAILTELLEEEYDWDSWYKTIEKIIKKKKGVEPFLEESPKILSFDEKDIIILKNMVKNPDITLRELGELLGLSQPQVHNRIGKLEKSDIIKGYKPTIMPFESTTMMSIMIRSSNLMSAIVKAFYILPFYTEFSMESMSHYQVKIDIPSTELGKFLFGVMKLREHSDDLFVQFLFHGKFKGYDHIMSFFDTETKNWSFSLEKILKQISDIAK